MKGLSPDTEQVFNLIKRFELLKDYILIGGTALSIQIHHRLSEDLDFCKWQDDPGIQNKEISWPEIERSLKLSGTVKTDILDLYQVNFSLNNIKISFYSNALASSYSILREGILLEDLVRRCGTYSRHRMKSKTILSILSNSSLFKYEENFDLLEPKYQVNSKDIEAYMRNRILEEYSFPGV